MLITSNTIAPILDAFGKPLANGTLLVLKGDTATSQLAQLSKLDSSGNWVAAANPIPLNNAGEIPGPVKAEEPGMLWCFAYSAAGILERTYPLYSGRDTNSGEENEELIMSIIRVMNNLYVNGTAKIKNLEVEENITVEGSLGVENLLAVRGDLVLGGDLEMAGNFTVSGENSEISGNLNVSRTLTVEDLEIKSSLIFREQNIPEDIGIATFNRMNENKSLEEILPIGSYSTCNLYFSYNVSLGNVLEGYITNNQLILDGYIPSGRERQFWRIVGSIYNNLYDDFASYLCVRIA